MLAVINSHVTVDIEKAEGLAMRGDSLLGQRRSKLRGTSGGSKPSQLAAQRFNFRRAVQSQNTTQVLGRVFFQALGAFDAPECHEQKRQ